MRRLLIVKLCCLLLSLVVMACGRKNLAEDQVARTPDEKAKIALESGDYTTAITTLEELIAAEPDNYQRYALLGAAYAARAGLAILDIIKAQFSGGGSGGGTSLFAQVGTFLSVDATAENLADMAAALARLEAIPEALRASGTESDYGASAAFQLSFYAAAYSAMYVQKFTLPDGSGNFDRDKLETMTDEDVDAIIGSLQVSAAAGEGPAAGMGEAVSEALAKIDNQPGNSTKEKLINYLNSTNAGGGGGN